MTGQPEALAEHAAACGELARAATAWLLAAEEAMRRFAAADAALLASKAIEAAAAGGNVQVAVRAQITRGQAHEAAGSSGEAFADYTAGAELARGSADRRQEMRALRELGGDASVSVGLPVSYCESQLASGLQIAESLGDRASEADLLSRLAIVATNRLRLDAAFDLSGRAVAAARAAADEQAVATGLDALKAARLCVGDLAGLRAVLSELGPMLRRRGDLFRLQWLEFESAFTDFAEAGWPQAEARMRQAIATNSRGGYPASAAWYIAHLGLLARLQGHDDAAIARGRRALEVAGQHEHHWWTAATAAMLGTSLAATGAIAEARELYERGLAAAQKDGTEGYILRCLAPLAALAGSADLLRQADDLLGEAASRHGAWMPGHESYLAVAQAWLNQREPDRCRAALAPLLTVARHGPWIPVLAQSLTVDGRALAALGRSEEARPALAEASRLATAHGMPRVRADATAALASL
jgi:tetratricopeptide (TPR) repeat protein